LNGLNYGDIMNLFWLSFAGDEGWRGGCFIEANSFTEAVAETHRLGISPGGEVRGVDKELTEEEEKEFRGMFELDKLYDKETLPDSYTRWE